MMNEAAGSRAGSALRAVTGALCILMVTQRALTQVPPSSTSRFELSDSVRLDQVDSATRGQLEQVDADIAAGRWDEIIKTFRQLIDHQADQVIAIDRALYVSARSYGQARIAALPPAARAIYRLQVDPLARQLYDRGIANQDPVALGRVVDRLLCSSWGDDALMALGEMALERGWYGTARALWQRVSAEATAGLRPRPPEGSPAGGHADHRRPEQSSAAAVGLDDSRWITYPDTDIDLADIRARLVLVSIREGVRRRARRELDRFHRCHPQARGYLGGQRVRYAQELASLLEAAVQPRRKLPAADWPTFAGAATRCNRRPRADRVQYRAWQAPLALRLADGAAAPGISDGVSRAPRGGGGKAGLPLSYHPLVVDNLLLVNDEARILAFNLHTGQPAWGQAGGVVFQGEWPRRTPSQLGRRSVGVPRFTMTARTGRLFARMGEPTTSRSLDGTGHAGGGYLVCLDLHANGRLLWKILPDGPAWAFDGSPLAHGANVYVAMRRSDVRPQAHVACFDAQTGRRRWRRYVCAAETPAQGQADEITHNLLTLAEGTLYFNTNLGAVAALSTDGGQIRWISLYPRARHGDLVRLAPHFRRDLNPCLYERGQLLVAPSDSKEIFALSAVTGRRLWSNSLPEDVTELLGVGAGNLIAGGARLWWLDVHDGKVVWRWPESKTSGLQACGRGVLVGDSVLWPTVDSVLVLPCQPTLRTRETRESVRLEPLGARGGNLVVAEGYLLIAGPDRIYGLTDRWRAGLGRGQAPFFAAGSEIHTAPKTAAKNFSQTP